MLRIVGFSVLVVTIALVPAFASYDTNVSAGMTLAKAPLAIHGYDPVAFFQEGKARIGSDRHVVVHGGAAYRFVSDANKSTFETNPEKYAPQYGGFCAYGVALGAKFDGDPRLFKIVDGKLYFNLNPDIQAKWEEDVPGHIRSADQRWAEIRDKAPSTL